MIRKRQTPSSVISPALRRFLEYGVNPETADLPDPLAFFVMSRADRCADLWPEWGSEILPDWIRKHPGTRPWGWWRFEAPEPCRHRLGGIGTSAHEVLAHLPTFDFGIPCDWVQPWDVAYFNGRARDIHGQPIGTNYQEGNFTGVAINPDDPPRFESQAAYLDRHS